MTSPTSYYVTRKGEVWAKYIGGTERRLADEEARKVLTKNPTLLLNLTAA